MIWWQEVAAEKFCRHCVDSSIPPLAAWILINLAVGHQLEMDTPIVKKWSVAAESAATL